MLAPATRLMNEYKPVLAKLHQDATLKKPKKIAEKCYSGLQDVQIVLGLACLMPMLRGANTLMKYAQQIDVFVCDYLGAVKQLQTHINEQYVEESSKYIHEPFWDFNTFCSLTHDVIPLRWVTDTLDLNAARLEYLAFEPPSHSIRAIYIDPMTKDSMPVTKEVFAAIIIQVKAQATCKFQISFAALLHYHA
jgi:hypothetical protein